MLKRYLYQKIGELLKGFPAVLITGPRQSGKTTLSKLVGKNFNYVSLENPDNLDFALHDPKGFFSRYSAPCILDEVQKAPLLLSYLQGIIDESKKTGQWILTGSHQLLLMQHISQTLAGRIGETRLLPFSLGEIYDEPFLDPKDALYTVKKDFKAKIKLTDIIFSGFFPRLHTEKINPRDWYSSYLQTYLERDVRDLLKVSDLGTFRKFMKLCAGRSGQLLNYASLASDAGISPPTVKSWLNILETSSLVALIPPYHKNFNKRLTKSPKFYFLDTGLLCYLLDIRQPSDIEVHPLKGGIFETFILSNLYKLFTHAGEVPPLYFWRDLTGHEIDVIVELGTKLYPIEIKSSQTLGTASFETLQWWLALPGNETKKGGLIHAGTESYARNQIQIYPWWQF